jgi:hypothetical protein
MNASTATDSTATAAADERSWLTEVLRPAGSLDQVSVRKLGAALGYLAAATNMVVVNLAAADVRDPRALARALGEPAADFERAGGCLLVTGASRTLAAELARAGVPVVGLGDNVVAPVPAVRVPLQTVARPIAPSPHRPIAQAAA